MIIDLFAGPGGWSTGLNMIGRAETVGIEWDKAACDTARAAGHERLQADIAELDPLTVALQYGITVAEAVDVYAYGTRVEPAETATDPNQLALFQPKSNNRGSK